MSSSNLYPASLLKDVSRSFYRTLQVLPGVIGPQIGLTYLLARTTDTIADTELVPLEQRLRALESLRERILGQSKERLDFGEFARRQGSPAERLLLDLCETSLASLGALAPSDLQLVRGVLTIITSGQVLDLRRFAGANADRIITLSSEAELDDYTYRVAGCVGEFWTKMCRVHLFPEAPLDDDMLLRDGVRFGKGLQLVNILRDLPVDLKQGRCYLPGDGLQKLGVRPAALLTVANEPNMRPLYDAWLDQAEAHLHAGWNYTNALPYGQVRVRLACAWPILIGFRTLKLLRQGKVLDASHRLKVSRAEIKRLILRSVLLYPWAGAWRRMVEGSVEH